MGRVNKEKVNEELQDNSGIAVEVENSSKAREEDIESDNISYLILFCGRLKTKHRSWVFRIGDFSHYLDELFRYVERQLATLLMSYQ